MSAFHRYYLPRLPNQEDTWSVVFVDQELGLLSIASDWGNFMHWWGVTGRVYHDFRRELLRFNTEYLENKLSDHENMCFDAEETIKLVREHLCAERRTGEITAEQAREDWNDVCHIDNVIDWNDFLHNSNKRSYEHFHEMGQYHPSNMRSLRQWLEKSWPRLQELLRADVAANPIAEPPPKQQAVAL